MDIELSSVIDAPIQKLWDTLLDPNRMARCVPGVVSVEIVSDREYAVQLQVRIAFIAARFKVRTTITELTPPTYLRCESSGEDSSIGSSVKSTSEMFVTAIDNRSELRVSTRATVLGKLGALGLNPMRTKAERMWEEFCRNLEAELAGKPVGAVPPLEAAKAPADETANNAAPGQKGEMSTRPGSWARSSAKPGLLARVRGALGREEVFIELRRNDTTVALQLPGSRTGEALAWLDRQLGAPGKS